MSTLTACYYEHRFFSDLSSHSYPKKEEKRALALKIVEAFPQLEQTRVTPDAPKEVCIVVVCLQN